MDSGPQEVWRGGERVCEMLGGVERGGRRWFHLIINKGVVRFTYPHVCTFKGGGAYHTQTTHTHSCGKAKLFHSFSPPSLCLWLNNAGTLPSAQA